MFACIFLGKISDVRRSSRLLLSTRRLWIVS